MPDASRRWTPVALPDLPPPAGAYSPAVRAGEFVFVSGQVPRDPRTRELRGETVEEQTRTVLDNLRLALSGAGASLEDVVAVTVYLEDENDWAAFNDVYKAAFVAPYPTRTVVGARLRGVLVELSAVAWLGRSR
jgi:2-iminobutanoate/2-iminopropanoate deaminase